MTKRLIALLLILSLASPGLVGAQEYDPRKAGHPLKIAYYVLYPIGLTLDWLIFRPAWHIGQVEPVQTLFGVPEPGSDLIVDQPERERGTAEESD